MKRVFARSQELVHLWANKTQPDGRVRDSRETGRPQAFFEGDLYFSYGRHYCIGRHLPDGYVAINTRSSSKTTNKHVREARLATRHLKQLFVEDPDTYPDDGSLQTRIDNLLYEASTRSPETQAAAIAKAHSMVADFNKFKDLLGLARKVFELPAVDMKALAAQKRKDAKEEREREKARQAEYAKSNQERLQEWRQGLRNSLPYMHGGTLLRLSKDLKTVETSHGAQIPVLDAKRLWPVIERCKRGEKDFEVGMPLGIYRLTKIRQDGSIVVGCHDIPFEEIEGVARGLDLIQEVTDAV